ncbi:hypothetical protein WEB32_29730 [Streptomyces netropsis]|uniref:hypothetical protein n=1 Tax=Streptomyces netropsis TaxID=55404 RepID=UPI0030D4C419
MFDLVRTFVRDNPVRVRAAVGALLVLAGRYVPGLAVDDSVVGAVTVVLVLLLGESASRKVGAKYNPAPVPTGSVGDGTGR